MTIDQPSPDPVPEAAQPVAATLAPPYDPKAIFIEEWCKVVDPHLEADTTGREGAWDEVRNFDEKDSAALRVVPETTFRMVCKAIAHAWASSALERQGKEHSKQMRALNVLYSAELRELCGEECGALDVGAGLLRKCNHDHDVKSLPVSPEQVAKFIAEVKRALFGLKGDEAV